MQDTAGLAIALSTFVNAFEQGPDMHGTSDGSRRDVNKAKRLANLIDKLEIDYQQGFDTAG